MAREKLNDTTYKELKIVDGDDYEVVVGDDKEADFKPQVKIQRWGNDANFSLRLVDTDASKEKIVEEADKIRYQKREYEARFYDKGDSYELDIVLSQKPKSNVFEFTINTKNLDFFYQPPLTQEEIDEGGEMPDNVIGSYAVYHTTHRDHVLGGTNYKTGKAFHIYRPHVTDDAGADAWAELNIDEVAGVLTVTVPQAFLDTATYPVVVDPTFGYTTIGASTFSNIAQEGSDTSRRAGLHFNLAEAGTLDSLHVALQANLATETVDVTTYVHREDSAGADSHDEVASVENTNASVTTTAAWETFTAASESLSADDYILSALADGEDLTTTNSAVSMRRDTSSSARRYISTATGVGGYASLKTDPWNQVDGSSTNLPSIYATYTASPRRVFNIS